MNISNKGINLNNIIIYLDYEREKNLKIKLKDKDIMLDVG